MEAPLRRWSGWLSIIECCNYVYEKKWSSQDLLITILLFYDSVIFWYVYVYSDISDGLSQSDRCLIKLLLQLRTCKQALWLVDTWNLAISLFNHRKRTANHLIYWDLVSEWPTKYPDRLRYNQSISRRSDQVKGVKSSDYKIVTRSA